MTAEYEIRDGLSTIFSYEVWYRPAPTLDFILIGAFLSEYHAREYLVLCKRLANI